MEITVDKRYGEVKQKYTKERKKSRKNTYLLGKHIEERTVEQESKRQRTTNITLCFQGNDQNHPIQ